MGSVLLHLRSIYRDALACELANSIYRFAILSVTNSSGGVWGRRWVKVPFNLRTRAAAFAPGGVLAREELSRYYVAARIDGTLFTHGGLTLTELRAVPGNEERAATAAAASATTATTTKDKDKDATTTGVASAGSDRYRDSSSGCSAEGVSSGSRSRSNGAEKAEVGIRALAVRKGDEVGSGGMDAEEEKDEGQMMLARMNERASAWLQG